NRKLFRDILEMQFQVVEAGSAEEAVERLKGGSPDLILMDMQLPGMSGLDLVRQLKADPGRSAIPIVGLSAHAMPRDIADAGGAGCSGYSPKPIPERPFPFLERVGRALPTAEGAR